MEISTLLHLWGAASSEQLIAPITVVGFVFILCAWYFVRYFCPSFKLSSQLKKLTKRVEGVKALAPSQRRSELERLFNGSKLEHSWHEYAETLHDQFEFQEGEQVLVRSRATAGAAHFFSPQSVVDTPLGTEFYKHLPGILTGIGIVGTFFGLMLGLQHFDPSTPEQVNASVDKLLKDVLFAFIGSFISIMASIAVTITEKWRLGQCYRLLEALSSSTVYTN